MRAFLLGLVALSSLGVFTSGVGAQPRPERRYYEPSQHNHRQYDRDYDRWERDRLYERGDVSYPRDYQPDPRRDDPRFRDRLYNAQPVLGGAQATRVRVGELVRPFSRFVIRDADSPPQELVVTVGLSHAYGAFTFESLQDSGFRQNPNNQYQYVFRGSARDAQDAIRRLVFQMDPVYPGNSATVWFNVAANDPHVAVGDSNTSVTVIGR